MPLEPIAAVLLLVLWVVFAFVSPVASGLVHLLYGAGILLLVRWWALTR